MNENNEELIGTASCAKCGRKCEVVASPLDPVDYTRTLRFSCGVCGFDDVYTDVKWHSGHSRVMQFPKDGDE